MRNKTILFRLLAVLCIVFNVNELSAKRIYVDIPSQSHERRWGTINIPAQTVVIEDDDDEYDFRHNIEVEFSVTNLPEGFEFSDFCSVTGNSYPTPPFLTGTMSYYNYLNINDLDVIAKPLPIKSPQDMVNVINGFEPGAATLNGKGEVVLLTRISCPAGKDPEADIKTGRNHWPIQTNVTIVKGADDGLIERFDFDIENSFVTSIDGTLYVCGLYVSNSTIGIGTTGWVGDRITIWSAEGNVVFKGTPYGEQEFGNLCQTSRPIVHLGFNFDDVSETATISVEDLDVIIGDESISTSKTINFRNCWIIEDGMSIQGGNVNIVNCMYSKNSVEPTLIVVERGKLQTNHSDINANINIKGTDAYVEINGGKLTSLNVDKGKGIVNDGAFSGGITINGGALEVNDGHYLAGITVNGGELEVNNGAITSLNVMKEDCKIELNNGHFKSVYMPVDVKKPILSLLGPNASYYDRDGTYMPFKLVDIEGVEQKEGAIVTGMVYPVSFVISNYGSTPSAAYMAAQNAGVGPSGKDIRVRDNGDLEIWTPEGMAWLAFVQSDTHDRMLTGREYFMKSKDWYLMADIDMDGYGTGWPNLNVAGRTFYGQQHRIYNMNVLRPDASFFNEIDYDGIVRDLIVEGGVTNQEDEGGREITDYIKYEVAGFANANYGLVVNCAYKGSVWNTAVGNGVKIGGFVNYNSGRIENCYVAPCGQLIGGVRNEDDNPLIEIPCWYYENYSVGGFATGNSYKKAFYDDGSIENLDGYIQNCYFGGNATYNVPSSDEGLFYTDIVQGINSNTGAPCEALYFLDADISAETLNRNALEHTPEAYDGRGIYPYIPWASWTESADKQCGRPYFVWEKNLGDTPSGIDDTEAQGGFKAWSEDGMLCFSTDGEAEVMVYSVGGKLCARHAAQAGTERIALPKGIYIVACGGKSKKVVL